MDVEVKAEILSPIRTVYNNGGNKVDEDEQKYGSTKKLDVIDMWRSRVLFYEPKQSTEDWTKRIEKQMAVLKVTFPFLTERQIRGKAWKNCGFTSIMGGLPRSGLSPQVKKEFSKQRNRNRFKMSRVRKDTIKTEKGVKKIKECPYTFTSPSLQIVTPQKDVHDMKVSSSECPGLIQSPLSSIHSENISQMSGIGVLSNSSGASSNMNKRQKSDHVMFDIMPASKDHVIKETPELSCSTNTPYCSPNIIDKFFDQNVIIPSLGSTQKINDSTSSCVHISSMESATSKTVSGLDKIQCSKSSNNLTNDLFNISVDKEFENSQNLRSQLTKDTTIALSTNGESASYKKNAKLQNIDDASLYEILKAPLETPKQSKATYSTFNFDNNNVSDELTPVKFTKFNDARKKIMFTTVAQVHHNDSDVVENNCLLHYQQCKIHDPVELLATPVSKISTCSMHFSIASPNEIDNTDLNLHKTDISSSHSIDSDEAITPALQDMHEEHAEKVVFGNSGLHPFMTNFSMGIAEEKVIDNQILSRDSYKYKQTENSLMKLKSQRISNNAHKYMESVSPGYCFQINSLSLPFTQDSTEATLPSDVLLSNYCSEYDKAYAKANLKPVPYRNYYSKVITCLKEDFDKVIPPEQSLGEFFEAPELGFKKLKNRVRKTVIGIINRLEEYESDENCDMEDIIYN